MGLKDKVLSMQELQGKVEKICSENNMEITAEQRMLDITSEIGEVAKEVLLMSDYGKKDVEYREELESEMGDVLFSLLALANQFEVDLEDALSIALDKYEERLMSGSMGSNE